MYYLRTVFTTWTIKELPPASRPKDRPDQSKLKANCQLLKLLSGCQSKYRVANDLAHVTAGEQTPDRLGSQHRPKSKYSRSRWGLARAKRYAEYNGHHGSQRKDKI